MADLTQAEMGVAYRQIKKILSPNTVPDYSSTFVRNAAHTISNNLDKPAVRAALFEGLEPAFAARTTAAEKAEIVTVVIESKFKKRR